MTVEEARTKGVCRICKVAIPDPGGAPVGWQTEFGERIHPKPAVTLKFGDEFAHTECLPEGERMKFDGGIE